MRLVILLWMLSILLFGLAHGAPWSREYVSYQIDSYIDDDYPTTCLTGDSVLVYDGATKHKAHFLLKWTVPSLNAGEVLDSLHIVATLQAQAGGYPDFGGLRVHHVLRSVDLSAVTWNEYDTGQSWATAGGLGTGDCDLTTDYGNGATGIIYQLPVNNVVAYPRRTIIARGSGLKTWAHAHLIGSTATLMWDSYMISSGEIKFYSSYANPGPGPSLWLYGHETGDEPETTTQPTRRRRAMMEDDSQ